MRSTYTRYVSAAWLLGVSICLPVASGLRYGEIEDPEGTIGLGMVQIDSGKNLNLHLNWLDIHDVSTGLKPIVALCVIIYGLLSLLWAFFLTHPPKEGPKREYMKVALLCVSWASCSVGMHVLNRCLAFQLTPPVLITLVQMAIAVGLVGICSFRQLRVADRRQLGKWMIVPIIFAAIQVVSYYTYQYISGAVLTVVWNVVPLLMLSVERRFMPVEKQPSRSLGIVGSIIIMTLGAIFYGGGQGGLGWVTKLSIPSVIFALVNIALAMLDRLVQRRLLTVECKELSSAVCTVMNNFWEAVPTIIIAVSTQLNQLEEAARPEKLVSWSDWRIVILLLLSGAVCICICYIGFECQRAISATSFFVLQNGTKVPILIFYVVLYRDTVKSVWGALGMLLILGGSFCYGVSQMQLHSLSSKCDETEPLLSKDKAIGTKDNNA